VAFGTEIVVMLVLGLLLLGPKRLPTILRHVARAKAQFETATHSFKSQLEGKLQSQHRNEKSDPSQVAGSNQ
jgi:Sec-independent protein translocase protein TatA